jgi:ferritin
MLLSDKLTSAINDQINAEFYSAYLYLSMAAHCEAIELPGFANWLKQQAKEEVKHGMRLFELLNDRDARVALKAIAQPPVDFASPVAIFEEALRHEQHVSGRIHSLYALSLEEKDYPVQTELQWFIKEQVEEEKTARQILEQLKIGDSGTALIILDRELGSRSDKSGGAETEAPPA